MKMLWGVKWTILGSRGETGQVDGTEVIRDLHGFNNSLECDERWHAVACTLNKKGPQSLEKLTTSTIRYIPLAWIASDKSLRSASVPK